MEKRGCHEQDIIVFEEKDGRSEDVRMDESALFSLFPIDPPRLGRVWHRAPTLDWKNKLGG